MVGLRGRSRGPSNGSTNVQSVGGEVGEVSARSVGATPPRSSRHGTVLSDYDFHPDEATVRIFRTPTSGVLRLEDDIAVTEAIHGDVVLRHYSFADHWFKINVTTDLAGNLVETGDAHVPFAFNCDIATPMEYEEDSTYAVDLFVDVLVRADASSYLIGDEDVSRRCSIEGWCRDPRNKESDVGFASSWTSSRKDTGCRGCTK
jgi:hypothetical protein